MFASNQGTVAPQSSQFTDLPLLVQRQIIEQLPPRDKASMLEVVACSRSLRPRIHEFFSSIRHLTKEQCLRLIDCVLSSPQSTANIHMQPPFDLENTSIEDVEAVAKSLQTPPSILNFLANAENLRILTALSTNPHLPGNGLTKLGSLWYLTSVVGSNPVELFLQLAPHGATLHNISQKAIRNQAYDVPTNAPFTAETVLKWGFAYDANPEFLQLEPAGESPPSETSKSILQDTPLTNRQMHLIKQLFQLANTGHPPAISLKIVSQQEQFLSEKTSQRQKTLNELSQFTKSVAAIGLTAFALGKAAHFLTKITHHHPWKVLGALSFMLSSCARELSPSPDYGASLIKVWFLAGTLVALAYALAPNEL